MDGPAPEFVVRLHEVALHQDELASRLGVKLDRYEPLRHGTSFYAQVVMPDGARDWLAVAWFLEDIGPKISALIRELAIGSATIDFATFMADQVSTSVRIPARIAALAGEYRIDIETSTYLTLSES